MLISKKINDAINQQIGNEFGASLQYVAIAVCFDQRALPKLAGHFYKQAQEERDHAMRFVKFLVDADGEVKVPGRHAYSGRMTVTKAIASAGYFTDFARKTKVRLIRVNGKKETIDCVKAEREPSLDLLVYPGDSIHVPRRLF